MDRELLEKLAMEKCSSHIYYELCDFMDVTTNQELIDIINCDGDYKKECAIWGYCDED